MAYRKSHRYSRQLAAARAARARKREEGPEPDYPVELPELRREVVVVDYDTGVPLVSHWRLYRTSRVDCYRVVEAGREWAGRHGWAPGARAGAPAVPPGVLRVGPMSRAVLCDHFAELVLGANPCRTCVHGQPHEPWLSHVSDARDCSGDCGGVAVRCVPVQEELAR